LAVTTYGINDFEKNLATLGVDLSIFKSRECDGRRILMPFLSATLTQWILNISLTSDNSEFTDLLFWSKPNSTVRRVIRAILAINGAIVQIEVDERESWEDYNGKKFYAQGFSLVSNRPVSIQETLTNFRNFLFSWGLTRLKSDTVQILPGLSPAFVYRMPPEVRCFYYPDEYKTETWFPKSK